MGLSKYYPIKFRRRKYRLISPFIVVKKPHISLAFEIKGARGVVVMILDNGPSDRGSISRET